jgi:hypothetical protein
MNTKCTPCWLAAEQARQFRRLDRRLAHLKDSASEL